MIVYVQRDVNNNIIGVYKAPQPGLADEAIDASDAGIVAFLQIPQQDFTSINNLKSAVAGMLSDIATYQANQDTGTAAQIQTRDHAALKGAVQDIKLILLYLRATYGN